MNPKIPGCDCAAPEEVSHTCQLKNLPAKVLKNLVKIVDGRYWQKDHSWFEQAGENAFTHHCYCEGCGEERMKVNGRWDNCSCCLN
jgi:hypothetical protein